MERIAAELDFIKITIGSFEYFENDTDRKKFLKDQLSLVNDEQLKECLKAYIRLSEVELKAHLFKLQDKEVLMLKNESPAGKLKNYL